MGGIRRGVPWGGGVYRVLPISLHIVSISAHMVFSVGIVLYLWFMGYYDNTEIREKIDSLLRVNAAIQASVGTKSKHDVGGYKQARDIWIQLLYEIRVLDEEYYKLLTTPEEQRAVERLGIVLPGVI